MPPFRKATAQTAPLNTTEIRSRLTAFAHSWNGGKDEKQDAQVFTLRLLECYGLKEHNYRREGSVPKLDGSTGYMDGFIPGKLIIEFKSLGKNLKKAAEQAMGYHWGLPAGQQPSHILLCDFERFVLIDLAAQKQTQWTLSELPQNAQRLRFLIDEEAQEILEERDADRKAAYQISRLHQALVANNFTGKPLEVFLTRLLFCLFADDTGMFGDNGRLLRFVQATRPDGDDLGSRLAMLFQTLNKDVGKRQKNLDDAYASFPYVNGSLFAETLDTPIFDSATRQLLIDCCALDWKTISPAIFGAMFQGVLEAGGGEDGARGGGKRRELGAHYTSERNILRAINPLFMDGLRAELAAAGKVPAKLETLLKKLPSIHLFDPACGCGNFLVIAYRELRLLELTLIERLYKPKNSRQAALLELSQYARVSPDQLHGIEIEDSAAHIARVAILITDHQINEQSRHIGQPRPTIPLHKMPNIVCANALTTDWQTVLPAQKCSFIVGNPPFVGSTYQSAEQTADAKQVLGHLPSWGLLDFVACWHVKATAYMRVNPKVRTALVSTNSICQGQQVPILWGHLLDAGVHIQFAHRTFQWSNEGIGVAAVHCIILGFGLQDAANKVIFDYSANPKGEAEAIPASNINPYLMDAKTTLIDKRRKPLQGWVQEMVNGSKPTDGGNLLLSQEEADAIRAKDPIAAKYIRTFLGADEFINNTPRYCLWLPDATAMEKTQSSELKRRIAAVRTMRLASTDKQTKADADTSYLFQKIRQPKSRYLLVPSVSSEIRDFVPIGFLDEQVIVSNLVYAVPNATLYHLGVLCSTMHNAWMRTVAGRLKSDYRYSNTIVYNNFPWPAAPDEKASKQALDQYHQARAAIEKEAQAVLDARAAEFARCAAAGQPCSLAMLYAPDSMPSDLRKAHTTLDAAVDKAYGYRGGKDDGARVAFLFDLYAQVVAKEAKEAKPKPAHPAAAQ